MKITIQNKITTNNCDICDRHDRCNQNLCPLDPELKLRYGSNADKCRFMREPKRAKIQGREFISGGAVMQDALLKLAPQSNLEWLNNASQQRWHAIHKRLRLN